MEPNERSEREEQKMVTENPGVGASRNDVIFGSGLSGMVAAYVRARALEDDAASNENWSAQSVFRSRRKAARARRPLVFRARRNEEGEQNGRG